MSTSDESGAGGSQWYGDQAQWYPETGVVNTPAPATPPPPADADADEEPSEEPVEEPVEDTAEAEQPADSEPADPDRTIVDSDERAKAAKKAAVKVAAARAKDTVQDPGLPAVQPAAPPPAVPAQRRRPPADPKPEAPKPEAPKPEAPKPEAAQPEDAKPEQPKAQTRKSGRTKGGKAKPGPEAGAFPVSTPAAPEESPADDGPADQTTIDAAADRADQTVRDDEPGFANAWFSREVAGPEEWHPWTTTPNGPPAAQEAAGPYDQGAAAPPEAPGPGAHPQDEGAAYAPANGAHGTAAYPQGGGAQDPDAYPQGGGAQDPAAYGQEGAPQLGDAYGQHGGGFHPPGGTTAYPQEVAFGQPGWGAPQPQGARAPVGLWHRLHLPIGVFLLAYGLTSLLGAVLRWSGHRDDLATVLDHSIGGGGAAGPILIGLHVVEVLLTLVAGAGLLRRTSIWYLPALFGWMAGFGAFTVLDLWAGDFGKVAEHAAYFVGFTLVLVLSYALGVKAAVARRTPPKDGGGTPGGGQQLTRTQELALAAISGWQRHGPPGWG